MTVFITFVFIDIVGVVVVRGRVLLVREYCANDWVIIVPYGLFLTHLHPFITSLFVDVPEHLIIGQSSNDHRTTVWGDHSQFGDVLRRAWRQGFIMESIQFLIVLESIFQKVQETNSIDQDHSSSIGIQCVCE